MTRVGGQPSWRKPWMESGRVLSLLAIALTAAESAAVGAFSRPCQTEWGRHSQCIP